MLRAASTLRPGTSLAALAALLVTGALVAAVGCAHPAAPIATHAAKVVTYVSEDQCAGCHAEIASTCAAGNHARTMREASRSALGSLAPPIQAIPGAYYSIKAAGDRLFFASSADGTPRTMDLALGSGKLGMTFVSLENNATLTELRMSWAPGLKSWYLTPGQEGDTDNRPGEHNDAATSRGCLGCHATALPASGLRPESRFFGVGCQSCHGPASAHLAAMTAGTRGDPQIERIGAWSPTRVNEMCGKCHRTPEKVGTSGDEVTMTQRFQPYGLMQSPCFQKSGGALSCVTCHNPHKNAATDPHAYEAACLRCHSSLSPSSRTAGASPTNRVCPINPRTDCIRCHMPARKVFPVSRIPFAMADHLIWAYRTKTHAR